MEGKRYFTNIKNNHPVFGGNAYVRGVVMGIMVTTCDGDWVGPQWVDKKTEDHAFEVATTPEKYQLFAERVEKKYPGLCEFDYDIDSEK